MATITHPESIDQNILAEALVTFLESDTHPEHAELQAIILRVQEIKAQVFSMAGIDGQFPSDKIQEAQKCLLQLQEELQKIKGIHEAVANRWKEEQVNAGTPLKTVEHVMSTVLLAYDRRWNLG